MDDNNVKLELENLRLEFLKRQNDLAAPYRAKLTLQQSKKESVSISQESVNTGFYSLSLTINLFDNLDKILSSIENDLIPRIISSQKMWFLNCPEAHRPEYNKGKGQNSPRSQLEDIKLCLSIYDHHTSGLSINEIAELVYKNKQASDSEITRWESDCQKVRNHLEKAKKLIKSAENGTFPRIANIKNKSK